ncbi:helix-turn-helix domain-containing protein [Streptomyces sp. NPDC048301]|uniref:PucR family transcriptional regulator n=1 Tax=unclassified Streptomyces TaxID=2593676 RepID=UPI00341B6E2F
MTPGTSGDGPGHVTLRQILAYDDEGMLRLLLAPAGQDLAVHGLIVGDEGPARPHEGRIVLATGLAPDLRDARAVVREAARRGAAAVVLRESPATPLPDDAMAAAGERGIALLARAEWADWGDTVALLRSATSYASAGRDDIGAADPGGGLAALAAATARSCRGSITVEDTQFRVLAHSATGPGADGVRRSTILGGRVPEQRVAELRRSGLLRALWTSQDVIHRPADGDSPERLVVAVRNHGEMLGSLWAAADGQGLSPDATRALRRAAVLAVPHLLRHRLDESGTARREAQALRGLLHGTGDRRTHLWSLGIAPGNPCAVVVAVRDSTGGPGEDRTLDALAAQASATRPTARILREQHRIAVLLPVRDDGDPREVLALARELDGPAAGVPDAVTVRIGAGRIVASGLDASLSYASAVEVVRALRDREARGCDEQPVRYAGPDEVRPTIDALRMLDAARPVWESGDGPVHELIRADLAAGGDLVRSLAAYLGTAGDIPAAARRLLLHPNTLRYRIRRARERFGLDLDDPDTRLVLAVAVRLAGVV